MIPYFQLTLIGITWFALGAITMVGCSESYSRSTGAVAGPPPDPSISIDQCFITMAFSDLNRDDYLSKDEYVRFVNRISSYAYPDATFSSLPLELVNNFKKFATAGDGEIDIYGVRPGESANSTQSKYLLLFCNESQQALARAQGSGQYTIAPTTSKAPAPSSRKGPRSKTAAATKSISYSNTKSSKGSETKGSDQTQSKTKSPVASSKLSNKGSGKGHTHMAPIAPTKSELSSP